MRFPKSERTIRVVEDLFSAEEALQPLTPYDVNNWVAVATEFANDPKTTIADRFNRLTERYQTAEQDAADTGMWNRLEQQSLRSDPSGVYHRSRLAIVLGELACDSDGAPYVARALINEDRVLDLAPRLAALGDQLDTVRARMEEGRKAPERCAGVVGFTEDDWRRLETIKPDQEPLRSSAARLRAITLRRGAQRPRSHILKNRHFLA